MKNKSDSPVNSEYQSPKRRRLIDITPLNNYLVTNPFYGLTNEDTNEDENNNKFNLTKLVIYI